MPRPLSLYQADFERWDEIINSDPLIPPSILQSPVIREVCYAGQFLKEQLQSLQCPDNLINRILYTAGQLCFGQPDPWQIHQQILDQYINNKLIFDDDDDFCN